MAEHIILSIRSNFIKIAKAPVLQPDYKMHLNCSKVTDHNELADLVLLSQSILYESLIKSGGITSIEAAHAPSSSKLNQLIIRGDFGTLQPGNEIYKFTDDHNEFVGMAWLSLVDLAKTHTIKLIQLYVSAAHRNKSVGTQIMHHIEDIARSANASEIILNVFTHNQTAIKLYKKMGYTEYNQDKDKISMRKNLT